MVVIRRGRRAPGSHGGWHGGGALEATPTGTGGAAIGGTGGRLARPNGRRASRWNDRWWGRRGGWRGSRRLARVSGRRWRGRPRDGGPPRHGLPRDQVGHRLQRRRPRHPPLRPHPVDRSAHHRVRRERRVPPWPDSRGRVGCQRQWLGHGVQAGHPVGHHHAGQTAPGPVIIMGAPSSREVTTSSFATSSLRLVRQPKLQRATVSRRGRFSGLVPLRRPRYQWPNVMIDHSPPSTGPTRPSR